MRKTKKQKNTMCELTVVGLLVALLTACSSGETMEITSEPPAEKETSVAEASEEAESVETMDITEKWTGHRQDWGQIHFPQEIYFEERPIGRNL